MVMKVGMFEIRQRKQMSENVHLRSKSPDLYANKIAFVYWTVETSDIVQ